MPFLFIIIGVVMITAAVRDTVGDSANQKGLVTLLKNDFIGQHNFAYWVLSILVIGAIGYIKPLEGVSRMFMLLVVIVLLISNKGVFAQFEAAIGKTQQPQQLQSTTAPQINQF
jgi:hypothetical protein